MAELFEFVLVLVASSMFAGASVYTYASYSSFQSELQLHGAFAGLSGLASRAASAGVANGTVSVPSGTLSCAQGVLSFDAGQQTLTAGVRAGCSFSLPIGAGVHSFYFADGNGHLTVRVD